MLSPKNDFCNPHRENHWNRVLIVGVIGLHESCGRSLRDAGAAAGCFGRADSMRECRSDTCCVPSSSPGTGRCRRASAGPGARPRPEDRRRCPYWRVSGSTYSRDRSGPPGRPVSSGWRRHIPLQGRCFTPVCLPHLPPRRDLSWRGLSTVSSPFSSCRFCGGDSRSFDGARNALANKQILSI